MRPARAIASTAPGIAPRSTSAVTVVVMRSSRSDESPICSGRSARGKPSIVPWLVMAFSSAIPRLSAKCLPLAIAGTPLAFFQAPLLNLFKGHPIHTRSARIGAGQPIGMAQDVLACRRAQKRKAGSAFARKPTIYQGVTLSQSKVESPSSGETDHERQQSTFKRKTGPDRRGTKANSPAEAAVAARARLVNPRQVAVGAARLGNVPVLSP